MRIVRCHRYVIGHQHVGVANLFVDLDRLDEIDVAFVGIDFDELIAMPADVAEMNIEDLFARAEVADDIEDFDARIREHLRDCALAEVEPMMGTFVDADKFLEPVDGAQNSGDALISFGRHTRIVRVAGHANLVFICHRDDPVEEVADAFPRHIRIDMTGASHWRVRMSLIQLPRVVHGVATSGRTAGAEHTEDAHVVFDGRNSRFRAVLNELPHRFDVAIALGTGRQHDGRMFLFVDVAGRKEGWGNAIDRDAALGGEIDHAMEFIYGGVEASVGDFGIAADMAHSVAREVLQVRFVRGSALASQLHFAGAGRLGFERVRCV